MRIVGLFEGLWRRRSHRYNTPMTKMIANPPVTLPTIVAVGGVDGDESDVARLGTTVSETCAEVALVGIEHGL